MASDACQAEYSQHGGSQSSTTGKSQARHYDRDESYVRRWLPELSVLPTGSIHTGGCPSLPMALELLVAWLFYNALFMLLGLIRFHATT